MAHFAADFYLKMRQFLPISGLCLLRQHFQFYNNIVYEDKYTIGKIRNQGCFVDNCHKNTLKFQEISKVVSSLNDTIFDSLGSMASQVESFQVFDCLQTDN